MAVYFKIKMQYKRTHDGNIIETTGSGFALPLLERCIAAKKGPAPSRVLKDESFTFTSTEFPTDQDCCIRLCEASSTGSTFVRGILMVLDGESTHLQTFHTLLGDKVGSRRRLHVMPRGTREPMMFHPTMLRNAYATEQARYVNIHQQLRSLEAGVIGLQVVSSNSFDVPPASSGAAVDSSDISEALIPQACIDEDEQFALIFLSSKFAAAEPKKTLSCASLPTDSITKLFEDSLLSRHPKEDCWDETGSASFRKTLEYFLHRGLPIQFCLPAFPCKSTNPRKTSGAAPDGAEYEAFSHLHQFCRNLQKIYSPGADFTVVSDGHVFSDCIGTDDIEVYKYTDAVKELSDTIFSNLSLSRSESPITFVNLRDVFYGPNKVLLRAFKIAPHENYLNRPIKTQINPEDENCRGLMLRSCGFDAGMLEKAIKDDESHPLTKVYRGFSRFMKDVSSLHAPQLSLTDKCSRISMITRNSSTIP
jgi:pyoverdine/dityrosine biosynthesis protein Dit1